MWLSKGEFLLYDDSLLGDLERASGWIFETLVPGALVPLSCACCQSRSGRQRWYHISAEHEENCLSGEMTALFFPGGKLTLAHRNANLKTAHTASRNVNYFSCWHSVCNIFLLHDVYSLVSKLPQKCTFFFFYQDLPVPPPALVCKPLACLTTAVLGHTINQMSERTEVKNWIKKDYSEWGHGKEA